MHVFTKPRCWVFYLTGVESHQQEEPRTYDKTRMGVLFGNMQCAWEYVFSTKSVMGASMTKNEQNQHLFLARNRVLYLEELYLDMDAK